MKIVTLPDFSGLPHRIDLRLTLVELDDRLVYGVTLKTGGCSRAAVPWRDSLEIPESFKLLISGCPIL